jgi:hypothetical protein
MRVMPEGRELRGEARALEPQLLVLARRRVGRPKEWGDDKAAGPAPQEPLECGPNTVVEG